MPPRHLSAAQKKRLAALKAMALLLDSAFVVPGTNYRIGLDPIAGVVPGIGDLVSPLFAISILWQSRDLNIPRLVRLRMVVNVAIDAAVGLVPVLGDLFDAGWKANEKNYALLEKYAYEERPPAAGDWLFVLALIAVLLALAAAPVVLVALLLKL